MTPNKTRQILAAQKLKATPKPISSLPPLTADQRRELYAPRHATEAPKHLQGSEWVATWRTVSRVSYGLTGLVGLIFGGLVMSETRKSIRQ